MLISANLLQSFRVRLFLLLLFAFFIIFFRLGSNSLHNGDECRYGIITKQMVQHHNWLAPSFDQEIYFNKPPLRFWLTGILFVVFGISEWTIRFSSAAAAFGCVLFLTLTGRRIYGDAAGLWAGFALSTCIIFIYEHSARSGEMDAMILFFLISSLYFFIRGEERPSSLIISGLLMGLSCLTKNFAGFVPLGIALCYLLVSGRLKQYSRKYLLIGLAVMIVVSISWLVPMLILYKNEFYEIYMKSQVYDRFSSDEYQSGGYVPEARSFSGGLLFICKNFLQGFFPWVVLVLPALIFSLRYFGAAGAEGRARRQAGATAAPEWLAMLPIIWILAFLTGLLFLKNKTYWYPLPLYPAACLLIGNLLQNVQSDRWKLLIVLLLFIGISIYVPSVDYNPFAQRASEGIQYAVKNPNLTLGLILALLALVAWQVLFRRSKELARNLIYAILVLYSVFYVSLPLRFADTKSDIDRLRALLTSVSEDHRNLFLWRLPNALDPELMARRYITRWYMEDLPGIRMRRAPNSHDSLENLLIQGGSKMFLMPYADYKTVRGPFQFLGMQSVYDTELVLIGPKP